MIIHAGGQTQGTACKAGSSNAMESQRGDERVHRAARSCRKCSGAWNNPQVSTSLSRLSTQLVVLWFVTRVCAQAAPARHEVAAKYGPDLLNLKPSQVCIHAHVAFV